MIKVLLADDNETVRAAIKNLLSSEPQIQLVGEATTFDETLRMASDVKPDIVLLDLHMRGEENLDASLVKSRLHACAQHVLIISIWNDDKAKALADEYGATALLDKIHLGKQLVPAILNCSCSSGPDEVPIMVPTYHIFSGLVDRDAT